MVSILSDDVVRKLEMAKVAYDLASDCFNELSDSSRIGTGIILLQDSVEMFLLAVRSHIELEPKDRSFPEHITDIETKIGERLPLRASMLTLNKQRVNVKHYGFHPHMEDCKHFPVEVGQFFATVSEKYFKTSFESISSIALLRESRAKGYLKVALEELENGRFEDCITSCRKALYLEFELWFDIRPFEKEVPHTVLRHVGCRAPFFAKSKEYIDKHVFDPTDYIVYDHSELDRELLVNGILPVDYWNIWRLTPSVYHFEEEKRWAVKWKYGTEDIDKHVAAYCFRKTLDILLAKERRYKAARFSRDSFRAPVNTTQPIRVLRKAHKNAELVSIIPAGVYILNIDSKVSGFDDEVYWQVRFWKKGDDPLTSLVSGYIVLKECLEIIEDVEL